jgi:UDP-N-acetylglucosamine acyltransferase
VPDIHSTAIIEDSAQLADEVTVGPYCYVGANVTVGAGTHLMQGVYVDGRTSIGERNQVFPYAVLGTVPQDKKYEGEPSRLVIGDDNIIREHVTIHIGTSGGGGLTQLGNHNLLMAGAHVGHDCIVANHCVLANYVGLAGHVLVEDWVILGGQTGIHQFVRVGSHCMTSGGSKVGKDIPPFTIAQGYPARLRGINQVGLRRRGFTDATIKLLRQAYRAVFFDSESRFEEILARARAEYQGSVEVDHFLAFLTEAQDSRGFLRPGRGDENGRAGEGSGEDEGDGNSDGQEVAYDSSKAR